MTRALALLAVVGCAGAAGARPLVVMPPWSGLSVLLYPEELAQVRGLVTDFLAAQKEPGFDVVARDRVAAMERRIADGRLRDGGPRCAAPPTLDQVLDQELPDALRAWTNLDCGESGCTLEVIVHSANPAELTEWIWAAPVDRDGASGAWLQAARHLVTARRAAPAGFEYQSGTPPPLVRPILLRGIGRWRTAPEQKLLDPAQKALEACRDDAPRRYRDHWYIATLQVRQDGSVGRAHVAHEERDPAERCVASALGALLFDRGPVARRLRVAVVDDGLPLTLSEERYTISAELERLASNAGYALGDLLPLIEVRGCYVAAKLLAPRKLDVVLEIDEGGHVNVARVTAPGGRDPGLQACVADALTAARLPCAADGKPVSARFRLALTPLVVDPPEQK